MVLPCCLLPGWRSAYHPNANGQITTVASCYGAGRITRLTDINGVNTEGVARCVVSFDGLPEKEHVVIGGDTFQALELAVGSAESALRRLSKKYDFYFDDGELYFED